MKFKREQLSIKTNINPEETQKIEATIGDPAKIFKMFTKDLYKYPLQTAIQEYINNAKDAHVMVGKDTSTIEITAPTLANQNVMIKDFGVGLSHDDVVNIFSKITASNKDNSDKFNGGFGIGSKSWFSVNPFFYVLSTYNNIKSYYEVSFTDRIYIELQSKENVDSKNSVEVILPLANKAQIEPAKKAIERAIRFWKIRPKLINIELQELPTLYEDKDFRLIAIDSNFMHMKKSELFVTLGETQYSTNDFSSILHELNYSFTKISSLSLEIKFKIGEAKLKNSQEVGPDREQFTESMEPIILKKLHKFKEKLPSIIINLLQKSKNVNEIINLMGFKQSPSVFNFKLNEINLIIDSNRTIRYEDSFIKKINIPFKVDQQTLVVISDKEKIEVDYMDSINNQLKKNSKYKNYRDKFYLSNNFINMHSNSLSIDTLNKRYNPYITFIKSQDLDIILPKSKEEMLIEEVKLNPNPLIKVNLYKKDGSIELIQCHYKDLNHNLKFVTNKSYINYLKGNDDFYVIINSKDKLKFDLLGTIFLSNEELSIIKKEVISKRKKIKDEIIKKEKQSYIKILSNEKTLELIQYYDLYLFFNEIYNEELDLCTDDLIFSLSHQSIKVIPSIQNEINFLLQNQDKIIKLLDDVKKYNLIKELKQIYNNTPQKRKTINFINFIGNQYPLLINTIRDSFVKAYSYESIILIKHAYDEFNKKT